MPVLKADYCSSSVGFVLAWSPYVFHWCMFPGVKMILDCYPQTLLVLICALNFLCKERIEPEYEVPGENSLRPASK